MILLLNVGPSRNHPRSTGSLFLGGAATLRAMDTFG